MNANYYKVVSQILLGTVLLFATLSSQAQLTLWDPFHFRETNSQFNSDRHFIGVYTSPDASGGTTATACQGTVCLSMESFGNNGFFASTTYDPELTGSWQITAQNGAEIEQELTNDIVGIGPMPFVQNLSIVGGLPTPCYFPSYFTANFPNYF